MASLTCWKIFLVIRSEVLCIDLQFVALQPLPARAVATEVEVDVVADIDHGGLVGRGGDLYLQLALPHQPVGDAAHQVPGVALRVEHQHLHKIV